jgi:fucose permease
MYVGVEVSAGQWSFSLFTLARGVPAVTAGVIISAYWASLTIGRVLFGLVVNRVGIDALLRGCMLVVVAAAGLIWLNPAPSISLAAVAVLGLALAPIFPSLIAQTPVRFGSVLAGDVIGLQIAAAVLGGAAIPSLIGVLAARFGLEVVGPSLVSAALGMLLLHAALVRRACEPPRSARSQTDAVVSSRPRA